MESFRARLIRFLVGMGMLGGVVVGLLVIAFLAASTVEPRLYWAFVYWAEPAQYVMPVEGVTSKQIVSTFGAPRPGGRQHQGVDIFAQKGTPIVSATKGVVTKIGVNTLGGNRVWIAGEGHSLYYYAHMDHWLETLQVGQHVEAGAVIGFVGNTGDARTTPSHLHFEVHPITMGGLFAIDPVEVLQDARSIPAPPMPPQQVVHHPHHPKPVMEISVKKASAKPE